MFRLWESLKNADLISGFCDGAIIAWDTETGTAKKIKSTDSVFSLKELDTGDMISVSHKSIIIWDWKLFIKLFIFIKIFNKFNSK